MTHTAENAILGMHALIVLRVDWWTCLCSYLFICLSVYMFHHALLELLTYIYSIYNVLHNSYLMNYGFCVRDNSDLAPEYRCFNEIRLFLHLRKGDALYVAKRRTAGDFFCTVVNEGFEDEFSTGLAFLRTGVDITVPETSETTTTTTTTTDNDDDTGKYQYDDSLGVNVLNKGKIGVGAVVRISMQHDDPCSRETLSLARFICADAAAFALLEKQFKAHQPLSENPLTQTAPLIERDLHTLRGQLIPVSRENESAALVCISVLMEGQLRRFLSMEHFRVQAAATTATSAMPSADDASSDNNNIRSAKILVEGETSLCNYWIGLVNVCLPLLREKLPKIARIRAEEKIKDWSLPVGVRKYVRDVVLPLLELPE